MYISFADIAKEIKKPLDYKIETALKAIDTGFEVSTHHAGLAFSGGKDSTVLWHLIRTNFPDKVIEIIYGNTGVEFPESLSFARQLGKEWGGEHFHETQLDRTKADGLKYEAQCEVLEWLIKEGRVSEVLKADGKLKTTRTLERKATPEMWEDFRKRGLVWPKGTLMSYWWCCDQYGFPILGKAASKLDAHRINIDCFLRFSESVSEKDELLGYYDVLKECKFSQHCCKLIKKEPSEKLQAELDIDVIFKGLMASESQTRRTNFATRGYLFKSHRPHLGDDPFYHCNPLQIWTDADIWEYIHRCDVPYAPLYDMGYTDSKGIEHKIQRNGCYGCCTDILYKDNHLAMLRQTHPSKYDAIMKYGMADELKKLYHTRSNGIPTVLDLFKNTDKALEVRPCVFDDIGEKIDSEGIDDEYDPELTEVSDNA
jgi:3'-phosphoadenosine 5'-phosphosulfate sulfotransferase (PAPS reductase)/FAD synthetase